MKSSLTLSSMIGLPKPIIEQSILMHFATFQFVETVSNKLFYFVKCSHATVWED